MKKKRIKIESAKAKGDNLQRWACEQISQVIKIPWGTEDEDLIRPRPRGQHGVDVILVGEAIKRFPASIESKSSQQWSLLSAIRQARKNRKKDTVEILILKRKEFKHPFVLIDAYVFFNLFKKLPLENPGCVDFHNCLCPIKEDKKTDE